MRLRTLMTNLQLKEEWRALKATFTYSHIKCFVCHDKMYYGLEYLIPMNRVPVFTCNCFSKISMNEKCIDCGKKIEFRTHSERGFRMRCSCGHSDIVLVKDLENTLRI